MKKQILLVLLLLTGVAPLSAQEDIVQGRKYTMHSDILGEGREYLVYTPASYDVDSCQTRKYPVIYLIDGEMYFYSLAAIQRTYARGRQRTMPESIVVGVVNTDRTRDLTPSKSAYDRNGKLRKDGLASGGGGEAFFRFLTAELRAQIDRDFRTDGENILVGHSYGGLFTLYAFTYHTESFDKYIALDPSLWWDNRKLATEAEKLYADKSFAGKVLYIGAATKPRADRPNPNTSPNDRFKAQAIAAAQTNGLIFYHNTFPDDTHGTLPMPGMMDAFKRIYSSSK